MKLPKDLQAKYDKLTEKQKRFVDLWDGNQDSTAKACGYGAWHEAGVRALKNDTICHCIKYIREIELKPNIATRQDRQKFWTDSMNDVKFKPLERMKASELLGRSEGDFIERYKDESGTKTIVVQLPDLEI